MLADFPGEEAAARLHGDVQRLAAGPVLLLLPAAPGFGLQATPFVPVLFVGGAMLQPTEAREGRRQNFNPEEATKHSYEEGLIMY